MESVPFSDTHDAPISGVKDDRLARKPFASSLVRTLLADNPNGATVVAVMGGWGTGKSSVAAMVAEELDNQATVVRFEPWMVGSREGLAREFFATIGNKILPKEDTDKDKKARSRFYRYSSKIMSTISTGAGALSVVVPGVGIAEKGSKAISEALNYAAEGLEAQAIEPTLRDARDEISSDLAELTKPAVIIIDDIDRLDKEEVRITFQLIKACADFPNIRYLLLFDRDQVCHALKDSVTDPEAFLEKIVSRPFDLPEATRKQRSALLEESLLSTGIHENLGKSGMERLSVVFDQVLLPGLSTVRHVKRFITTIETLLPSLIVEGTRNIDPADFLALEFLRQYVPTIYSVLREEEAPRPGGRLAWLMQDEANDKKKEARAEALDQLGEPKRSLAIYALEALGDGKSRNPLALMTCRFSTDYWKPVYLGFHEARASVSQKTWQEFKSSLRGTDSDPFWLHEWDDREARDRWIAAIVTRAWDIEWPESKQLMKILFEWGDKQHPEEGVFTSSYTSWESAVMNCVSSMLEISPDGLDPVNELNEVIKSTTALVAPAIVVGMELEQKRKGRHPDWSEESDLAPLQRSLARKVKKFVESGEIWNSNDVRTAFSAVRYILGDAYWTKWFDSIHSSEEALVQYLNLYLGQIVDFNYGFDEGPLVAAIRDIAPEKLNESGRRARLLTLNAVRDPLGRQRRRRPRLDTVEVVEI
ncbi:KAP family P-loop NTPase fold protein [Fimbriimonas ginsengisoli]|uniref:KAP NTPase domain-containing protein n=1 Tax=Fimbriimonas ginsengisoli Gsoil 348 TaxID=661478 RepID=A0A068NW82_FIMGI|nr:P-loop NTPase fold protein [Fimbriimonas ginsengisoli]AIE87597.1 hypothetical protein OP10G_4229 [Fimbriimonas ginsengisoli Gsoil 348]